MVYIVHCFFTWKMAQNSPHTTAHKTMVGLVWKSIFTLQVDIIYRYISYIMLI